MPIEFYCRECDTFLRTPDAKAGLSAKCPACQERIWVPYQSEVEEENPFEYEDDYDVEQPADTSLRRGLPSEDASQPWEDVDEISDADILEEKNYVFDEEDKICSYCGQVNPGNSVRCESCNEIFDQSFNEEITQVDLGDIFKVSWKIYSKHLGICILAILIDFLLTLAAFAVVMVPSVMVMVLLQGNRDVAGPATMLVFLLGLGVCVSVLWLGHFRFFLALARGEKPEINEMFQTGPLVGRMVVASFGFMLMIVLGLMACVIPGLIALALFWPFGRFLVDHECSAGQSLSGAYALCKKNLSVSIAILVISVVVQTLSNVLVIGILFAVPFNAVLLTVAYLHFSGEYITGDE